jgi:hypothetical protein
MENIWKLKKKMFETEGVPNISINVGLTGRRSGWNHIMCHICTVYTLINGCICKCVIVFVNIYRNMPSREIIYDSVL